jgi:putative ABC transport system permease protein
VTTDLLAAIWRSAVRERTYAAINLAGLAVGFACCLVLGLFVRDQLTFDRHFANQSRIYRLAGEFSSGTSSMLGVYLPRAIAPILAADYPQVEDYVRFTDASLQDGLRLRHGERVLNWRRTFFADSSVFKVFSHKVLAGDPATALVAASSVAVSRTLAKAYFGDADPIGQLLTTDANEAWKVTLVFDDLPPNTHLRYDALFADKIPLLRDAPDQPSRRRQLLSGTSGYTYLLMRPGFEPQDWDHIVRDFMKRNVDGNAPPGFKLRFWLQPLSGIHYGEAIPGDQPMGNRTYLYGCVTVAVFLLIVACINYTNLAAARAFKRARSVALRKILGAGRGRLLCEILLESVLYSLAAAALALALAEIALTLTPLGELLGRLHLDLSSDPQILVGTLLAAMLVGLAAGIYPAIYLASWMPTAAFSARGGGATRGTRSREVLVLLQFVMAVGVVAATLVMVSQMHYVASTPLGFQRDNIVMVTIRGVDKFDRVPALAQQLKRNPDVLSVTQTRLPPGPRFSGGAFLFAENDKGEMQSVDGDIIGVGADFLKTLRIELMEGQDFSADLAGRAGDIFLVNETLARARGWKNAIGRRVGNGRVIGVVRDFHMQSLRQPIMPLALEPIADERKSQPESRWPFLQRSILIRVSGSHFAQTMRHIESVMTRFDPGNPFEYTMLDDSLRDMYGTERRMLTLIAVFATLCLGIACLGLFGLTSYATRQRSREIAIRKVLGASPWQVVLLLSRRVLLLIGVGGLIAAAAAWLVMDDWLAGFAYRVGVNPLLLVASIALAAGVALGTVALQSLGTARADPADALRYE